MHVIAAKMPTSAPASKGFFDKAVPRSIEEIVALQTAVVRAALLDMDLAISVYFEAGQRDLRSLASSVVDMSAMVATTAGELEGAANGMSGTAKKSSDQSAAVAAAAEQASANVRTVAQCCRRAFAFGAGDRASGGKFGGRCAQGGSRSDERLAKVRDLPRRRPRSGRWSSLSAALRARPISWR